MNRYLLNISYVGTNFKGLQKNIDKIAGKISTTNDHKSTVQGAIELGLSLLKPINNIKLVLSSRTDAGVHAIHSTVHVDLQRHNDKPYHLDSITICLNRFFHREQLPIRIIQTEHVPETFHARYHAKSRTYLYRLGTSKPNPKNPQNLNYRHKQYVPIDEIDRCYFVHNSEFDVDKAVATVNLLKGRHDFRTFMGKSQQNSEKDHPFFALRCIDNFTIKPSNSLSCNSNSCEYATKLYNYWDIKIQGRSFLNRQVRRMVGTIIAVAQNRISLQDVYEMLTIPSSQSWCSQVNTVPAHGLYLCTVDYDKKHKEFPATSEVV